ncbi:DUF2061 domain-containing protein [Tenacibaculum maritimum]|uniref:DUF2061 domain-containing protein n=1 Tax=Tenacibaculum maritimum TaxID=107401 RepID=UPI0023077EDD|nr:DUF2061 domain-containing protein [Tenacibaculum maritimum]MDB0602460.1 DUF2061 domain-containing protein [Tenacibaculum maritimum]MDB0613934.1 DUF2061 domain-containing protein [Tenacibaculum maritimum]
MIINQFIKKKENSKLNKQSEKPLRSILKSISWRLIGTLDTVLISWLITGKLALAFSIGSVELITKMILYFFHERIWNSIKWGK